MVLDPALGHAARRTASLRFDLDFTAVVFDGSPDGRDIPRLAERILFVDAVMSPDHVAAA
jgi:hypothetical protein